MRDMLVAFLIAYVSIAAVGAILAWALSVAMRVRTGR